MKLLTPAIIRSKRRQLEISQEKVALEVGVEISTMSRWEVGLSKFPLTKANEIWKYLMEQEEIIKKSR